MSKDLLFYACFFFLKLMLLWLSGSLQAQNNYNFKFKRLTIDEGLSSNYTNTVFQTQDGFLWIATDEGVNRFDGYEIKKYYYEEDNANSITNNYISSFYEDASGQLWVGANAKGFCRYDKSQDHFIRYNYLQNSLVEAFFEDSKKNLWVFGTTGVVKRNPQTKEITPIPKLDSKQIAVIYQSANPDKFWIGSRSEGVLLFDTQENTLTAIPKKSDTQDGIQPYGVRSLYLDKMGVLWIGYFTSGLLSTYDTKNQTFRHYQHQRDHKNTLPNYQVTAIVEYKEQMWIGTENGGIALFNEESQEFHSFTNNPKDPQSLSSNSIAEEKGFYEDLQGRLWIATHFGGLNVIDPHDDKFNLLATDLPDPVVNAVYMDHRQRLWVGTEKGLLKIENQKSKLYVNAPILTIAQDVQQRIWIGTWSQGLGYYDETQDTFVMYQNKPQDKHSTLSNNVYYISSGNHSDIWVGGYVEGIGRMSLNALGKFENYVEFLETERLVITKAILEDEDKLWLGTVNGLILFNPKNNSSILINDNKTKKQNLTGNHVKYIYKDSQQRLWIGTTDGLNLLQPDSTFKHITTANGLPNNVINSITEDEQGNLWIATNDGLSRFNPKDMQFRNFDKWDGLQSNQFRANSNAKDAEGRIYLGGMKGLNIFDPKEIQENPHIPEVHITGLRIFNQSVEIGDYDSLLTQNIMHTQEITLTHLQSVITLEFVALNFTDAQKNQYAYKLEGFEENWNHVGSQRNATYTNLDAGTYTFRVKASNNDGIWNEEGANVIIHVLPPWWETWWFRSFVILLVILAFYIFYMIRTRNIQHQNERLEELVSVRTFELEEKNAEVLSQAEEMQQQAEEMQQQAEELATQRDHLSLTIKELEIVQKETQSQKKELEIKNQQISHSIRAAQTIQQAILPHKQKLNAFFSDYFLVYQPKDIVSGDFFWLTNFDKYRILVTADCTGHGVPGAIMSIIGKSVLEKVILKQRCTEPSEMLEKIHHEVCQELKQSETKNNLGMDLSILVLENNQEPLTSLKFAGAKTSIFVHDSKENTINEIKGSRRSIGGIQNLKTPFETHQLLLAPGSLVYTGSDGYIDQNDKRRKSFGTKAFKKLLLEISNYPLTQQKETLKTRLEVHMQDTQQRDDILLIGFKV